jgi:hypothetical protein
VHTCVHRSDCSYIYEYLCLHCVKKNQFFLPVVTAVGTRHCALTDTSRCMQLRPLKFLLLRRSLEHRYGGVFAVAVLLRELSYGFRYGGVPCRTFTNYDNRLYSIDVVDLKLNRRFFFLGGVLSYLGDGYFAIWFMYVCRPIGLEKGNSIIIIFLFRAHTGLVGIEQD